MLKDARQRERRYPGPTAASRRACSVGRHVLWPCSPSPNREGRLGWARLPGRTPRSQVPVHLRRSGSRPNASGRAGDDRRDEQSHQPPTASGSAGEARPRAPGTRTERSRRATTGCGPPGYVPPVPIPALQVRTDRIRASGPPTRWRVPPRGRAVLPPVRLDGAHLHPERHPFLPGFTAVGSPCPRRWASAPPSLPGIVRARIERRANRLRPRG